MTVLSTAEILATACRDAGIPAHNARLLRAHSNTVYVLPEVDIVARISANEHDGLRARAGLTATVWLAEHGIPVTEPALDRAVDVGHATVTFWRYYPQHDRPQPPVHALGTILRQIHALPAPPFPLPDYPPLLGLRRILESEAADVLTESDRNWLTDRAEDLITSYHTLPTQLGQGLVHGDAYRGNTLWDNDIVRLGDWDEISFAPRELDLANTIQSARFGTSDSAIEEFLRAYGTDPRNQPLFEALVRMRDLHTLTGYIRRAHLGDPAARGELDRRIACLQHNTATRWVAH
ncbi:phosphotransferase enzyme family protein [Nocardia puris]|nr:phosphotransferase [Nocardia puris]